MTQRPPGSTTTRDVHMQVAGYRIQDILGQGASSIVFSAIDAAGRPVALKVTKPDLALSPRERQRFLEEAARLRRVRHPSLVEVLDAGEHPDGGAFIAMPLLPGLNLVDRLRVAPMRFDVTLTLFEQLAGALHAIHSIGLVHRDIKPENIFVVQGDKRAILLDLGIARDVAADPSTTTRAGMIRGTPAYMAPERFFGKPATPQTDIYELGVVLYVTLVGALPWSQANDPTERLNPISPAQRGVVLPPRLATTLMSALAAQSERRPQSAVDFASAVTDALSPESARMIGRQDTGRAPLGSQPPSGPYASIASRPPVSGFETSPTERGPVMDPEIPFAVPPSRAFSPRQPNVVPATTSNRPPQKAPKAHSIAPWIGVGIGLAVAGIGALGGGWYFLQTQSGSANVAAPAATTAPAPAVIATEPARATTNRVAVPATKGARPSATIASPATAAVPTATAAKAPCGHPGSLSVVVGSAPGVKIGPGKGIGAAAPDPRWLDEVARASAASVGVCRPQCGSELVQVLLFVNPDGHVPLARAGNDNNGDSAVAQCAADRMKAAAPVHDARFRASSPDGAPSGLASFFVLLDQK
jgi:serine/threonine-protein kinase